MGVCGEKGPTELQTLAFELLQRQQALAREERVPGFPCHWACPARYLSSNPPAVWGGELPGYQSMCVKPGLSCPKGRCGTWSYCLSRLGQEVSLITQIFSYLGWNSAETLKGIIFFLMIFNHQLYRKWYPLSAGSTSPQNTQTNALSKF